MDERTPPVVEDQDPAIPARGAGPARRTEQRPSATL